jgi:hypothetical protein
MQRMGWFFAGLMLLSTGARAEQPLRLLLQPDPETVYAPPALVLPEEQVNEGGVNFELSLAYLSDYMFRGQRRFGDEVNRRGNFQYDGVVRFDLGRMPHPFFGVFVNVARGDEVSRFQEIRPQLGFDWTVRPLTLSLGHTSYIFPDRQDVDTSEVWLRLSIDDSFIWDTDQAILQPYLLAAYDYRRDDGWYMQLGVEHHFRVPDTDIRLRAVGHVAYVHGLARYATEAGRDRGFPYYQVGVTGSYGLNTLLNIPRRYGQWELEGYLLYNGRVDRRMQADDGLWGGAGVRFSY